MRKLTRLSQAYALFDMAYTSIAAGTTPQKKIKKIRQVRQDAKAALKSISTRLKALVEELSKQYKGKQKLVSLAWLQDFEQVRACNLGIMSLTGYQTGRGVSVDGHCYTFTRSSEKCIV